MSWADVVSQVQAIEARFQELGLTRSTTSTVSSTGATSFASALDGASAPTTTTSATASTDGTLVSPNGATGADVLDAAKSYLGTPYVLGGESKSGIDCSGLVQAALKQVGVDAPRLVHEQQRLGQEVGSLKDAEPGDLIVLNGGDHIAIWAGNGSVIHAPYAGRTVSLQKAWFTDADVTTIRRVVPSTDDASSTGVTSALSAATAATGSGATGMSPASAARATAMLGALGAMDGSSASSSGSGTSLASLLSSFGVTGTAGSSSAQQLIAAQSALLGTSD